MRRRDGGCQGEERRGIRRRDQAQDLCVRVAAASASALTESSAIVASRMARGATEARRARGWNRAAKAGACCAQAMPA